MKLLLSVGQIDWLEVKDLSAEEQFRKFSKVLLESISRIGKMKRKPKNFDSKGFALEMEHLLAQCSAAQIEHDSPLILDD